MGYDIDVPWKDLPKKDRDWILFTEEQPIVPVYSGYTHEEIQRFIKNKRQPNYMGTFTGARRYVRHTFANTQSALMKKRVSQYMLSRECPLCHGKRLRRESLSIKFAGYDIADLSRLALNKLAIIFAPYATGEAKALKHLEAKHPEKVVVAKRIAEDFLARLQVMLDLGLGYLTIERSTPTLSPGELQRLRLATQVRSNLFGVVYVLDEPSAGLHPADTEALLRALDKLKASGNSLFVVEHEIDVIRHADWIVDVGPAAGEQGGHILYSGLPEGLKDVEASVTRHYIYDQRKTVRNEARQPKDWLQLDGVTRNNLVNLNVRFPLGVLTSVSGVSGSGKSSLVSQVLVELVAEHLDLQVDISGDTEADPLEQTEVVTLGGRSLPA